jgi:hypothetical protein
MLDLAGFGYFDADWDDPFVQSYLRCPTCASSSPTGERISPGSASGRAASSGST